MADHVDEKLSQNRKDLERYRRVGASGYLQEGQNAPKPAEDQMRIVATGDVHLHPQPERQQQPQGMSTLAKVAIAGLTGGGIAALAPLAIDWLSSDIPEPQPPTHTETTRDYQIGEITIE